MKNVVILRHISRNGTTFVVMERLFSYENDPHRSEMTMIVKKIIRDKFVVNLQYGKFFNSVYFSRYWGTRAWSRSCENPGRWAQGAGRRAQGTRSYTQLYRPFEY